MFKFCLSSYLNNHSSEHSYLDHRYPGGPAFIPWLLTMPRVWARGFINLGHLRKVFFYLSFMKTYSIKQVFSSHGSYIALEKTSNGRTTVSLVTLTCGSWSKGLHDMYFTVQWFCLISWRLFDVWTPYFRIMSQYDPTFDLKINVGNCDLYFMVHWFCLISWRLFDVWTSYFGLWVSRPDIWHKSKCRSPWPIFHGSSDLPYILKTILMYEIIFWDYESVWHDMTSK